jgi:hypothetical protein
MTFLVIHNQSDKIEFRQTKYILENYKIALFRQSKMLNTKKYFSWEKEPKIHNIYKSFPTENAYIKIFL